MAAFHESIPANSHLEAQAPVWRYMSFPKFASMLARSQIFMARADRFEDLFEGAISVETFSHYLEFLEEDFKLRDKYALRKGPRDRDADRELIQNWLVRGRTMTYLSCWYVGSSESDAMWRVYGETRESVAIRSNVGRLLQTLPDGVFLVPVSYTPPSDVRLQSQHRLWQFAFKRLEFAYESELRCIKFDSSEQRPTDGHQITVDLSQLVERVVVSPRAPKWFADAVIEVVSRFGLSFDVSQSSMAGGPWQF